MTRLAEPSIALLLTGGHETVKGVSSHPDLTPTPDIKVIYEHEYMIPTSAPSLSLSPSHSHSFETRISAASSASRAPLLRLREEAAQDGLCLLLARVHLQTRGQDESLPRQTETKGEIVLLSVSSVY